MRIIVAKLGLSFNTACRASTEKDELLTVKVRNLEDRRSTLSSSTLKLSSVNLQKVLRMQELSEKVADGRLDSENGEIGVCSEVDDSVVESGLEGDCRVGCVAFLFEVGGRSGGVGVEHGEGGVDFDFGEDLVFDEDGVERKRKE